MRSVVLTALASLLLVTSGCKSACRQLTEKQCECTQSNTEKTACLSRASAQETLYVVNPTDEEICSGLLETCDCRLTDTQAGKERCGFAVGPDAGP
jgi:hypothetical protein